jgi:hypothetical protein
MELTLETAFCPLSRVHGFSARIGRESAWGFNKEEAKARLLRRLDLRFPVFDADLVRVILPKERGAA